MKKLFDVDETNRNHLWLNIFKKKQKYGNHFETAFVNFSKAGFGVGFMLASCCTPDPSKRTVLLLEVAASVPPSMAS